MLADIKHRRSPDRQPAPRIAANVVRRPFRQDHAAIQHRDAMSEAHDNRHIVLDQEDSRLLRKVTHKLDEIVDLGIRKTLRRFIENEQFRTKGEAHGNFEQALVAVCQRSGDLPGAVAEADALEMAHGFSSAVLMGREGDILGGAEIGVDAGDLERIGDAQSHAFECGKVGDVCTFKEDGAGAWRYAAGDETDESGLAGAIGADDGADFTGFEFEVDRRYGLQSAKTPRQVSRFQKGCHGNHGRKR